MDEVDEPIVSRDDLAIAVMMKALDKEWGLFHDPKYLAAQSYKVADAMLSAKGGRADE